MDELMTVQQVAEFLSLSDWAVRDYIKRRKLGCYKISSRVYKISPKHIAEFLASCEVKPETKKTKKKANNE